jgi:hypothetical protein
MKALGDDMVVVTNLEDHDIQLIMINKSLTYGIIY